MEFSESIRQFIRQYTQSVEQLEILLLVSREPTGAWTPDGVYKVIQSNPTSVAARMEALASFGFLTFDGKSGEYRFSPRSAELAQQVEELRQLYDISRVRVIEAIFSGPGRQAQHFADSFRFRKDK